MVDVHRTAPDCRPQQPSKRESDSSARWPVWTTARVARATEAYRPAVRFRWVPIRSLKSSSNLRRLPSSSCFRPTVRSAERQSFSQRYYTGEKLRGHRERGLFQAECRPVGDEKL